MITFVEGSLFSASPLFSFAQCISGDVKFGMFRGISVQFLKFFPELEQIRLYEMLQLGEVLPWETGGKFIYNLVTKQKYWCKPVPYNLFVTLKDMRAHASANFVSDIAMPFLGAGRDKLDFFNVVFPMIKTIFEYSPINIHIYYPKSQVIHMKRLVYVCSHAQYYYHLYLLQLLFQV